MKLTLADRQESRVLHFNGAHLRMLSESFQTRVISFERLQNLHEDEIRSNPSGNRGLNKLFAAICDLTFPAMVRMNEQYPGIPPDTFQTTHTLLTTKGAKTVVLTGIIPGEEAEGAQVLGYGLIIQGRDNILDLHHIPEELKQHESASRINRLFVTDDARFYLARGDAFTQILNRIKTLVGEGPGIAMILEHMECPEAAEKGLHPETWYDAWHANALRGLDSTGLKLVETLPAPDCSRVTPGAPVTIDFTWYVWPPVNPETIEQLSKTTANFETLQDRDRERLACTAAYIPGQDAVVLYSGRSNLAYVLAGLYPGNVIVSGEYTPPSEKRRSEGRPNLLRNEFNTAGAYLQDKAANTCLMFGITPDIAADGDCSQIARYIEAQARQLKPGGTIIIRDTLSPKGPDTVKVVLSRRQKDKSIPSPDAAFREFISAPAEPHLSKDDFASVIEIDSGNAKTSSFIVPMKLFAEFRAKYPYYRNWETERKRPYTIASAETIENMLAECGMRLIHSTPEHSPWQKKHFDDGQIIIQDLAGNNLGTLPDHHIIVAEKVRRRGGVAILDRGNVPCASPSFVGVQAYLQCDASGNSISVQEIGTRKGVTVDVVPYFVRNGKLFVKGRLIPRPILAVQGPALDGSQCGSYQVEQIAGITPDQNEASIDSFTRKITEERGLVAEKNQVRFGKTLWYLPRAKLVDEKVIAVPVLIKDSFPDRSTGEKVYELDTAPRVRTIDAVLHLQGCQKGSMQDARLERVIYHLLHENNFPRGSWLGECLSVRPQRIAVPRSSLEEVFKHKAKTFFKPIEQATIGFLAVHQHHFEEVDANGTVIGSADPEFIRTNKEIHLSSNSIPLLPVMLDAASGDILAGLEIGEYAAMQNHADTSSPNCALATIPTYHLPVDIRNLSTAKRWVARRMKEHFGVTILPKKLLSLGGKYRVSPGISPEIMYPLIGEVDANRLAANTLHWVRLADLKNNAHEIRCGLTQTAIYRACHMFGI